MLKSSLILTLIIFAFTSFAQTNFSGNWELNKSKSKLNADFSMAPNQLVITQTDNELVVEKHSSFQGESFTTKSKYTLDGKECVNEGWQSTKFKSNAVWSADKKSLKISSIFPMMDGGEMNLEENYQMNNEGLIIETKASSSFGDLNEIWSFEKKE